MNLWYIRMKGEQPVDLGSNFGEFTNYIIINNLAKMTSKNDNFDIIA